MLRVFHKSIVLQNKCSLSHNLFKDLNLYKCVTVHQNFVRNYASKTKDDTKFERIYYGNLTPQIRSVKVFSVCSSIAGLCAQPILVKEASNIGSTSLLVALCSVVGFFTFVTPILLHLVTKKYVTEMHYDPSTSTYRATTISFFLIPKKLDFTPDDVVVPDIPGMFTTMQAKGKPLFIEARHFNDPLHYAKIMGYDKPLDFKLGNPEENKK
ncbi:transmembrane protein 70 homolog, mitochondrial [Zerene cesonia]|uniref:transmembrane protein 70 homolog, mitochondrial n=1 Tax=Zerene cesonia TaxID=33412 RepID=UPI0018E4F49C|nr:transmembrane protein 70 homolog, mitochondrial [Zerene cesonia]